MHNDSNYQSQWRIELTKELIPFYSSNKHIKMILLGGSAAKGLSDAFSDLDIIVYWDEIDHSWLENKPLSKTNAHRKYLRNFGNEWLESYYLGTLKADFGHTTIKLWEDDVNNIIKNYTPDISMIKAIGGFCEAISLYGKELYEKQKKNLFPYPEQLAINIIKSNFYLYVKNTLLYQGVERGDILYYYDGICLLMKRILNIIPPLNMVYTAFDEPRWIEYELEKMKIKPKDAWKRMKAILTEPDKRKALDQLYDLLFETLMLVNERFPSLDALGKIKLINDLAVEPCNEKPKFEIY